MVFCILFFQKKRMALRGSGAWAEQPPTPGPARSDRSYSGEASGFKICVRLDNGTFKRAQPTGISAGGCDGEVSPEPSSSPSVTDGGVIITPGSPCEEGASEELDSGALDSGVLDSGALDSGALDSGALDSGALDSGVLGVEPGIDPFTIWEVSVPGPTS